VQRKVFRIERMVGGNLAARAVGAHPMDNVAEPNAAPTRFARSDATTGNVQTLERELAQLNDAVAHIMRELAALIGDNHERHMTRAAGKLGGAIEAMEQATNRILKSSEVIEDSAKALTAAMKTDYERSLVQEIQNHVVKIYEACNFQDLSGQRIGNVIETLTMIEDRVEGMLDRHQGRPCDRAAAKQDCGQALLNGPRIDGDSGHTSQQDIDILFD
jgi:chemotaxis protein CheZ